MGEARVRGKRHREIFERQPHCIYCGGIEPATTVDHIPASSFFTLNQRPKGLEFSSCEPCNHGARNADLVVAIVGRCWPDAQSEQEATHFQALLARANRVLPGIIEEMRPPRAAEKRTIEELRLPDGGGLMRLDGPIVSSHMEAFAARLGLALHYDLTGQVIGSAGGACVRLYSNIDSMRGEVPEFDFLDAPKTLSQGQMSASGQFLYSIKATPSGGNSILYATFRQAFAAAVIVSQDAEFFNGRMSDERKIYRPGLLATDIPRAYRNAFYVSI